MAPSIRELQPAQEEAWDRFVDAAPEGTFFHKAGWRGVIEGGFHQRAHYLFAEQDGAVSGVLPLVHMRSRLFGNRLISAPFCVYGGPLASDAQTAQKLLEAAIDRMGRLGAKVVELRTQAPKAAEGWAVRSDLYATFRKPITPDREKNLKAIPRKQRAVVRKGLENRLEAHIDHDADRFHRLYAESVRNLGTPVFSRRYLRLLIERFRGCSEILTVLDEGKPIAAVLSFFFRDEVLPYYGANTPAARHRAASDYMYWEVMQRAAAQGARLFDFGRSKYGTGSFSFKKNWGFAPEPLNYQYWTRPGEAVPEINPLNPKYELMIRVWKRLPLPVANLIGPPIVRGIG
jgi:FemAB-related protein (PEP-CTERM system-associated)